MEPLAFSYSKKSTFSKWYLGIVFCCGLVTSLHAASNDRGLIINGLIHLERTGATIFWWCLSSLATIGPVVEIWHRHSLSRDGHQLLLTKVDLCVPTPSTPREDRIVPLTEITGLTIEKDSTGRLLIVKHRDGVLPIYESCLPKAHDLDELHAGLEQAMLLADLKKRSSNRR